MMETWAKLFTHAKYGQVLVLKGYDDDDDNETLVVEYRGGVASLTRTFGFVEETARDRAFDHLTQDNIAQLVNEGGAFLDLISGE